MTDGFDQPQTGGTWFKPADHNGNLILVLKVHEIRDAYDNLKKADVPRAEFDYVDLDDRTPDRLDPAGFPVAVRYAYDNHPGVVNKLKPAMGTSKGILCRIGQVPSDKGNHAWVIAPYNDEPGSSDAQRARDWLAHQNTPNQPASSPPATSNGQPVPTPPATAPPAVQTPAASTAPPQREYNGVKLDEDQYQKLVSMGIIGATA